MGLNSNWRIYYNRQFKDEDIQWINSENWHKDQITSRGALPNKVCNKSFLIIGLGALGAIISEMIVRAGVSNIVLIDSDT